MEKEYEEINGKNYAILWRKKGNKLTDKCPFCGEKHVHGKGEGHRIKHCSNSIDHVHGFSAKDGTYLDPTDGYIIREY